MVRSYRKASNSHSRLGLELRLQCGRVLMRSEGKLDYVPGVLNAFVRGRWLILLSHESSEGFN